MEHVYDIGEWIPCKLYIFFKFENFQDITD